MNTSTSNTLGQFTPAWWPITTLLSVMLVACGDSAVDIGEDVKSDVQALGHTISQELGSVYLGATATPEFIPTTTGRLVAAASPSLATPTPLPGGGELHIDISDPNQVLVIADQQVVSNAAYSTPFSIPNIIPPTRTPLYVQALVETGTGQGISYETSPVAQRFPHRPPPWLDPMVEMHATTPVQLAGSNEAQAFPLPIEFRYYDRIYGPSQQHSEVFVSSNGLISFEDAWPGSFDSVPHLMYGPPKIAVAWDDLHLPAGGHITVSYGTDTRDGRSFVAVLWHNIPQQGPYFDENTFGVVLYEGTEGEIVMHFGDLAMTDGTTGLSRGGNLDEYVLVHLIDPINDPEPIVPGIGEQGAILGINGENNFAANNGSHRAVFQNFTIVHPAVGVVTRNANNTSITYRIAQQATDGPIIEVFR